MQVGSSFSGLVNTVPGQESHWVAILVIKLFDRPQPRPTQDGHLQDGHGERPALQRRVWRCETAGRREARDGGGQEAGESLYPIPFIWSPFYWSSFGNTFNWYSHLLSCSLTLVDELNMGRQISWSTFVDHQRLAELVLSSSGKNLNCMYPRFS